MSTTAKWIVAIIVIILIIAGIWYYGAKPLAQNTDTGTGPIKIGVIVPLTGEGAAYGLPMSDVVRLAIDKVNAAGGVNGRQLEAIYEDGKCDGREGATVTHKLIDIDKVQVIIGGFCSSESLAAIPIAEPAKVLLISGGSSSPDLTGASNFFVRTYPSDATQGNVLAEVAIKKGWKKVAFIQEQQDYALGIYKAFATKFQELGGQVVKEEYAVNSTDFKTQLTKLGQAKPDVLFVDSQAPGSSELIIKQLQELKWKTPLIFCDTAIGDRELFKKYSQFLEGTLGAEFATNDTDSKFQDMVSSYKSKYGKDLVFPQYSQTMYDIPFLLADGMKAVGNNGEKLATWMTTVKNWNGASGQVTIGANGDRIGGHIVKIVKNGEVVPYQP